MAEPVPAPVSCSHHDVQSRWKPVISRATVLPPWALFRYASPPAATWGTLGRAPKCTFQSRNIFDAFTIGAVDDENESGDQTADQNWLPL